MAPDSDQREGDGAGQAAGLPMPRWALWLIASALVFGAVARWIWVGDMEWGADQVYLVEKGAAVARGEMAWPWMGMGSSVGLPNFGPSVWIFAGLATFAPSPEAMCRASEALNILAIFGFVCVILSQIQPAEREPWLWGLALAAVNPPSVRYARRIWQQSITPPLTFLLWFGHLNRKSPWGALLWGLMGPLVGQVHMAGLFLAGGLAIWTAVAEWRDPEARGTRWKWWVIGSVLASLPLIPWALAVMDLPRHATSPGAGFKRLLMPRFWILWFVRSLGLDVVFVDRPFDVLHPLRATMPPIAQPTVAGRPTWGVGALCGLLLLIGLLGVGRWVAARLGRLRSAAPRYPTAVFYVGAVGLGAGLLMHLVVPWVHDHYLVPFFPFPFVWLALMLLPDRRLVATAVVAQALLTATLLVTVHAEGGIPGGEYGLGYARQLAEGITTTR